MRIHIISTINGAENEGMRNIAAHMSREFARMHTVRHSGLRQPLSILRHSLFSDASLIFARANSRTYLLARALELLHRRVFLICVQPPERAFAVRCRRRPLRCPCFALDESDLDALPAMRVRRFRIGIDGQKFSPATADMQRRLKQKYGFPADRPLVVHVGHCSSGRGLEDFLVLDAARCERLVVASGLFENAYTAARLAAGGLRIQRGFLRNVEEIYQMADVYLFPTRSAEHSISIPLSAMEALSCGTPVVGYESFRGLKYIPAAPGAITLVHDAAALNGALDAAIQKKTGRTLLTDAPTWREAAAELLRMIQEEI